MKTLLGTAYSQPTPEEMQAIVRRAHAERAQVMRQVLSALFRRRGKSAALQGRDPEALRAAA
jgi:hypothetical protein